MNSNKCKHGFDVDANGNHIIPPNKSTISKEEQERWLNRKKLQLELEEANRKKREGTVAELVRLLDNY